MTGDLRIRDWLFSFLIVTPPNNVFDLRRWTRKRKKGMRKKNQRFSATRLSAFHSGFEPQERRRWYVSLTCVINPESYKYLTPAASAASRRKAKTLSGHFLGRTFHKEQRIRELTVRPKENARQSLWWVPLIFSFSFLWLAVGEGQSRERKEENIGTHALARFTFLPYGPNFPVSLSLCFYKIGAMARKM